MKIAALVPFPTNFFFFKIYLFFGCDGSLLLHTGFSSCGGRGLFFNVVHRLLIAVTSRCRAQALGMWASEVAAFGLSSCSSHALGHWLSSHGTRALWHVGSSWTREWTSVLCIASWILNHWATREAQTFLFVSYLVSFPPRATFEDFEAVLNSTDPAAAQIPIAASPTSCDNPQPLHQHKLSSDFTRIL